jgi:hypothetical protein
MASRRCCAIAPCAFQEEAYTGIALTPALSQEERKLKELSRFQGERELQKLSRSQEERELKELSPLPLGEG